MFDTVWSIACVMIAYYDGETLRISIACHASVFKKTFNLDVTSSAHNHSIWVSGPFSCWNWDNQQPSCCWYWLSLQLDLLFSLRLSRSRSHCLTLKLLCLTCSLVKELKNFELRSHQHPPDSTWACDLLLSSPQVFFKIIITVIIASVFDNAFIIPTKRISSTV